MAQIDRAALAKARTSASPVTVGNNRTVRRSADGTLICALHGNQIVAISPKGTITLDPCGYRTTTTRAAMKDFIESITGWRASVSFAAGAFTARVAGTDYTEDANGQIIVT